MALDYQQIHTQIRQLGEDAPLREQRLSELRKRAWDLFHAHAGDPQRLGEKVRQVAQVHDPTLRCALPVRETLDAHFAPPDLPPSATMLAADGSQIAPDRHAEVEYSLINVGVIEMRHGSVDPPRTVIFSQLLYDYEKQLHIPGDALTDATLALMRDLNERSRLAELACKAQPPVITFADGPMELWGVKDGDGEAASEFQKHLAAYKKALGQLHELGAATAGYVDKPGANLVVRLLEVLNTPETDLPNLRQSHPLRGITDRELYRQILGPGERSAVFAMQSQSAKYYPGALALHFFYLNVGRADRPWLARVEIPAWVAEDSEMLGALQAALVSQCRIMGRRPYPYLLHRAHEAAVVSLEEKAQVTQMIVLELHRRGVPVGERSSKQAAKELAGRTSYGNR